jgi:hypothetical protein
MKKNAGWSKGLTKETDERVLKRAKATSIGRQAKIDDGTITIWNKGLTKETDERLSKLALQIKSDFDSGVRVAWHSHLTEETDERIKKKNELLRNAYANGDLKSWHAGKTADEDPRISKIWAARDAVKEYAHIRWTNQEIEEMLKCNTQLRLESIDSYRNDRTPALEVRCTTCAWTAKTTLLFAKNDRCPRCHPLGSNVQHQIADWIQSLGIVVGRNVKGVIGRRELDIFIPEKKLAIEFNGLYWHNENAGKGETYHSTKSEACQKLGIRLFHVFEDEWRDKRRIVESMIMARLGILQQRLQARRCSIVELDSKSREEFFEANHLDGDVNAEAAWGLKDIDSRIVFALSVRKPFHRSLKDKLEVARTCTVAGATVAGGLSRLTKRAATYASSTGRTCLMTYVDARLGNSGSYTSAGWTRKRATPPRFWWTDLESRFNRFKFKADKERGMSESLVAAEAGVVKIWGCPNDVYEASVS